MASYYKKVTKLLKSKGWVKLREAKGSHEIWHHPDISESKTSVPVNLKKRHTANGILKRAGIDTKV